MSRDVFFLGAFCLLVSFFSSLFFLVRFRLSQTLEEITFLWWCKWWLSWSCPVEFYYTWCVPHFGKEERFIFLLSHLPPPPSFILTLIVTISVLLNTSTLIDWPTFLHVLSKRTGGRDHSIIPLTTSSVVRAECDKRNRNSIWRLFQGKKIIIK